MGRDEMRDLYGILGVSTDATPEEIKHAYRRLARRYHPDSREVHTATGLFRQVQEAYAVLHDSATRQAHDRRREEQRKPEQPTLACSLLLSRQVLYTGFDEQVFYLLLDVKPARNSCQDSLPLNLAIAIDCSTSMKGLRLERTKEAVCRVVDQLDDDDHLAIVPFSDRATVALSGMVGPRRRQFKTAATALRAEGGTEILQGLRAGLSELVDGNRENAASHLILITDGRTYGDEDRCLGAATKAGDKGVGISAIGLGQDWNEHLLEEISARSGGTLVYTASARQMEGLLADTIRGLGKTVVTELTLTVGRATGARLESAFLTWPYLARLEMRDRTMRLGSLQADAAVRALLEVVTDPKDRGDHQLLRLRVDGVVPGLPERRETSTCEVWCTFVDEPPDESNEAVPPALLSALRKVSLLRLQERAWSALSNGDLDGATRRLEAVASQLVSVGEVRLARMVQLEAEHIAATSGSTARGRKEIKYGTRRLRIRGDLYG
ncbi:MAG: VWA domain-containing protein [Chloroflexota bacterium]